MSPALSFSGQTKRGPFWSLIVKGEKSRTTRKVRRDGRPHARVGDLVALYWKMRMPVKDKPIHLIGYAYVTRVTRHGSMLGLLRGLGYRGIQEYVSREGFSDFGELVEWWTGELSDFRLSGGGLYTGARDEKRLLESGPVEVIEWQTPILHEKPEA